MKISPESSPYSRSSFGVEIGRTRVLWHDDDFPLAARTYGLTGRDDRCNKSIWAA